MNKSYSKHIIVFLLICFLAYPAISQNEEALQDVDQLENTKKKKKKKKKDKGEIKKGWNFAGFPFATYDSDLGFQFGALANIYHYGDGSRYPLYDHSIYIEASWFTKGSGIFKLSYDSDRLIKGVRTTFDVSYLPDQAFHFYGFNGYESVYNKSWVTEGSEDYKTSLFYRYKREFFRFKADFQGDIIENRLFWLFGLDFYSISTSSINRDKFDVADSTGTLFDQYKMWDLIPESEQNGGRFTVYRIGLVYDTRDNEPNPWRGIWTEIILSSAPKFTSNMERGFLQLSVTHRQYFTLIKDRLSFAYRLAFQSNVAGYTPTYAQTLMFFSRLAGAYNEGLGGSKTLRGVLRNRVVGDGWVMGNFELRYRFIYFTFLKQNWYLGLSGFFDTGRVIEFIAVDEKVFNSGDGLEYPNGETESDYFNFGAEKFHNSAGAGLYAAINQNFIVAINYAKALNDQDGNTGFYVGINYIF